MRFFLDDFKESYNTTNPFGFFPDWEHYPKTGTHIGSDFVVPVGTKIFAPCDGEMFKVRTSEAKGNVGIFMFFYEGTYWALELCHLKELPAEETYYEEGAVIAFSGNTGSASTGAHLHAVLHRGAMVSKHYEELQSREDFLKLEKEGEIVDCYRWFCERVEGGSKE